MEVLIDGVRYEPKPQVVTDNTVLQALESRLHKNSDHGDITVRTYLHKLLSTLWDEQEGFNGKRPFGNSGWEYELHYPLIKNGFVPGDIEQEDDGDDNPWGASPTDRVQMWDYVQTLIDAVFFGVEKQ